MHYSDGINEVEMNSNPNIHQKMGQRALIPLYWGQGVDVSYPVLQNLNARFASSGGQQRSLGPGRPQAGRVLSRRARTRT
jgi:hypothetical protein